MNTLREMRQRKMNELLEAADEDTMAYRTRELKIALSGEEPYSIQVRSFDGKKSKWMGLDKDTAQLIVKLLK